MGRAVASPLPPKMSQSPRPLGGAEGGTLELDKGVAKTQRAKGGAVGQKWGLKAPEYRVPSLRVPRSE